MMSPSEYAEHRGFSRQYMTTLLKKGKLDGAWTMNHLGKKSIDSVKADHILSKNREPQRAIGREKEEPQEPPEPIVGSSNRPGIPNYTEQRSIREAYTARMSKIEYEEKIGKLVDAEKVKSDAFQLARIVRDGVLSVADRISPQLASMSDPFEVHSLLTSELEKALEELSRAAKRK